MARKHYRAMKKQVQQTPGKGTGIFIPKKKKNQFFGAIALFSALLFVHGILIGYIVGKK